MATKLEFNGNLRRYISESNYIEPKPNIWTPEFVIIQADNSIYLREYQKAFTPVSFEWCFTSTNGNGPGEVRVQIFHDGHVLDQNKNYPNGGTSGWRKYDFTPGLDVEIQIALDASTTGFNSTNGGYGIVYNEYVKLEVRNIMVDLKAA